MKDLEKFMAECEKNAIPDDKINLSYMPELTQEDFDSGHFKYWKPIKKSVTFRIDLDNLSWLQKNGVKGYQKKLNEVLRWARQNGCPLSN